MGDGRLRPLREDDPDAIAAPDPQPREDTRELVRARTEFGEGVLADSPSVILIDEGHAGAVAGVTVAGVDRDVVRGRYRPAEAGVDVLVALASWQGRVHHDPVAYHPSPGAAIDGTSRYSPRRLPHGEDLRDY